MRKRYVTESGSEYVIDFENNIWQRKRGENAAVTRTDSGVFKKFAIVNWLNDTRKSLELTCPPFNGEEWRGDRIITSTFIISEEEF